MEQLGHGPVIPQLSAVHNSIAQTPPEFGHSLEAVARYPDLQRPLSSGHASATEYYLPPTTSIGGYHHASIELPSTLTGYRQPQTHMPTEHLFNNAYKFPDHSLKTGRPSSSSSVSSSYIHPESTESFEIERGFTSQPRNRESNCSSSCSSPEFEQQTRENRFYRGTATQLVKEEADAFSPNEDGYSHSGLTSNYGEFPAEDAVENYRGLYLPRGSQEEPIEGHDHENKKQSHRISKISPDGNPKTGGKKASSIKVSEKRRQQNRAAQRAMRERRKRAAQHQEVHMTAILTENAHLRERVAYLSNLVLAHSVTRPGHAPHWNVPLPKQPPFLSPINTEASTCALDTSGADATSGQLPPTYPIDGPVNYHPPTSYGSEYMSHNLAGGAPPSTTGTSRPGTSDGDPIDGQYQRYPAWSSMCGGPMYARGNSPLNHFSLSSVATDYNSNITSSTVPSPTETEGTLTDILPRVGH